VVKHAKQLRLAGQSLPQVKLPAAQVPEVVMRLASGNDDVHLQIMK